MKKENVLSLGNYYGHLTLVKEDIENVTKYYLYLDCHSSTNVLEIDEETYKSLFKFEKKESFKLK